MKNERGITLIALLLTLTVTVIIIAVSINIGTGALDSTRLEGFYMQMEMVQKRVDDIVATNESYIDETGKIIYLKDQGSELNQEQKNWLANIVEDEDVNKFRYFTKEDLKDKLGVSNIDYNVFIDFENKKIVAEKGIEIDGENYYTIESDMYFVENSPDKNVGNIDYGISVSKYGTDKYKITIIPGENIGDLQDTGTVKYKKMDTNYWETSNNLEIIVDELCEYDIVYQDINKNASDTQTYKLFKEGNNVYFKKIIKISTMEQLLNISNVQPENLYVLMNDLEYTPSRYWQPIGETLGAQFDGKGHSIRVEYNDDGNYTIEYNESNNYSEPEYKFTVKPISEDNNVISNAEISINGTKTEVKGQQEILIKRMETANIIASSTTISYNNSDTRQITIKNPNKITSYDITLILPYKYVNFTLNPSPSDATVKLNGNVVNNNTVTVIAGSTVSYSVEKQYYKTVNGNFTTNAQSQSLNVTLDPIMVTYTINTNQSGVTVTINGANRNTITVQAGTKINWSVTKAKYQTQEGEFIIESTQTKSVTLDPIPVDIVFAINPTPSDAVVTINGQQTKSVTIRTGTQVSWSVSKTYYQGSSGSFTAVVDDYTENVTLTENPVQTLALTPSSVSGSGLTASGSANDGHTTSDYATASISSKAQTLTWTWNTDKFSALNSNARITAFSVVSKTGGTLSPTTSLTFKVGSTSFGTSSGAVGTRTITPSSRPTAAQLKSSNSTLEAIINKKTLGIGYWYGATINVSYQNP